MVGPGKGRVGGGGVYVDAVRVLVSFKYYLLVHVCTRLPRHAWFLKGTQPKQKIFIDEREWVDDLGTWEKMIGLINS